MQEVLKTLPLVFVMIAGPQIISAVFLATSERWKQNSVAYVAGAAVGMSLVLAAFYLIGTALTPLASGSSDGGSNVVLRDVVVGVLIVLMLLVYLNRNKSEPPKWMGTLQTAKPSLSFKLGALLLGVFPTDIMTLFVIGTHFARESLPIWYAVPFLVVTVLLIAAPALLVALIGKRAVAFLPRARDWMNANSWIVNEFVLVFFLVLQFTHA